VTLALVIGTRPEVVQALPLVAAARSTGTPLRLLVVSQHTDAVMSSEVLPGALTADWPVEPVEVAPFALDRALGAVADALVDAPVDAPAPPASVIVIGDTDTSLAAALAASEHRLPVVHVEAGLRSHDWAMKEERNRVLIDHLAAVCCPPTPAAEARLHAEHVHGRVVRTGDVHVDAFRLLAEAGLLAADSDGPVVATIHRRENILDPARLAAVLALLGTCERSVVLYCHPHTRHRLEAAGLLAAVPDAVTLADPLPFLPFVQAMAASSGVITDSGGVQKQAFLLGVPCLTVRPTTEWTETLAGGWNQLVDPAAARCLPPLRRPDAGRDVHAFGDGHAAEAILAAAASARWPG
jgi:UDP-N-acetylglucosamine 2-epimerase